MILLLVNILIVTVAEIVKLKGNGKCIKGLKLDENHQENLSTITIPLQLIIW